MRLVVCFAVGTALLIAAPQRLAAQARVPDGAALYQQHCASCHDNGAARAPDREALRSMVPQRVLDALETGQMISMATGRSAAERRAIAEFVTGQSFADALPTTPSAQAMCVGAPGELAVPPSGAAWNGWGVNTSNTRFQSAATAGLAAEDVPRLKLKWAFGFPGDLQSNAQATLAGGRVFVGSAGGKVYSLSAVTGCVYWFFDTGASMRAAISLGRIDTGSGSRYAAFFGDGAATAYALDAATGALLWKAKVDNFPVARITGSPTLHRGRLYVPIASGEEGSGASPSYQCCKFRGSVVALDAATGKQLWKSYTIPEEAIPTQKNKVGTQLWGPSGAPVWSSPAIDEKRNVMYITTGNNYSDPPSRMSDSFVAMDLKSGKILWSKQMTASDAYTSACRLPDKTNCAVSNGPDFDFSASPILVTLPSGKRALVAGQKSGIVHALDPDRQGEVLWETRVGQGGTMGGVQWGSATDGTNVYVANSDIGRVMLNFSTFTDADPNRGGGMFALRVDSGARVWYTPPIGCDGRKRCSPAQSAAVSAMPGVAFSGSVDGHMRAYSATDGRVVWDFDTIRPYETVNRVPARGGSLDGPGPAIGGGMIFFNSGYHTAGGVPGNVLLAFSVDGK
ncbi:MAG: PQQ-binding-like beta-propeller repeat protein [Acidobacteriota bacterium]